MASLLAMSFFNWVELVEYSSVQIFVIFQHQDLNLEIEVSVEVFFIEVLIGGLVEEVDCQIKVIMSQIVNFVVVCNILED